MRTGIRRTDHMLNEHLLVTWHRAKRENVDQHLAVAREGRLMPFVLAFDPTEGRYHGWIARWRRRQWNINGFRSPVDMSELDRIAAALAHFEHIRQHLPPDRRDVGLYDDAEDLRSAVPTRIAENARRFERERLRTAAMKQSEVLFRDGSWLVVRLRGFSAARFWGLGTRWCTTSSEYTFRRYEAGGQLVVFATPFGKFQLATASGMFRNALDDPFDVSIFRTAPPGFTSLLKVISRP